MISSKINKHTDVKRGDKVEALQKYGDEQFLKHNWAMSMEHHDTIYWKYILILVVY